MYDIICLIKSLSSYLADLAVPESLAASSALELFVVPASIIRNTKNPLKYTTAFYSVNFNGHA